MGIAALILKIMPSSPSDNLHEIEKHARQVLEEEGAKNISFETKEVAFGLKSIIVKMAWPEEKSIDIAENRLSKIKNVSSVSVEDYRRAFG